MYYESLLYLFFRAAEEPSYCNNYFFTWLELTSSILLSINYFDVLKYYSGLNKAICWGESTNIVWVFGFFSDINCKFARILSIFYFIQNIYLLDDRSLVIYQTIILCFESSSILFFIKVRIFWVLDMHTVLIFPSFQHLKIELILVLSACFKLKIVEHILFLMIVLCSDFVIFFLLQKP